MARPQVFLAELVRTLKELGVRDDATAREVMRLLSIESVHEATLVAAPPVPAQRGGELEPELRPPQPVDVSRGSEAQPRAATAAAATHATLTREASTTAERVAPAWLPAEAEMPRSSASYSAPLEPLFVPRESRALIGGLVAVRLREGDLDVERLIDAVARLESVSAVPRLPIWSVRRGAQVLIDRGPSMVPFDGDVEDLIRRVRRLVPDDRLELLEFEDCPVHGCSPRYVQERKRWKAPPSGVPVIVVSDFGIGGPPHRIGRARAAEWSRFADIAAEKQVSLRGLVPYAPSRWPAAIARRYTLMHWDRRTTAGSVRRLFAG